MPKEPTGSENTKTSLTHHIKTLYDSKDINERIDAAWALAESGNSQAIHALLQVLLTDKNTDIQHTVTWALVKIGGKTVASAFLNILQHTDHHDLRAPRYDAAAGLLALDDPQTIPTLLHILQHNKEAAMRANAADALSLLFLQGAFIPEALTPLLWALQDEDAPVRGEVVSALGEQRDPKAVEPLLDTLQDEDATVRFAVIGALEEQGDSKAVEPLRDILQNAIDPLVRKRAEEALENIRTNPLNLSERSKMYDADINSSAEFYVQAAISGPPYYDESTPLLLDILQNNPDHLIRALTAKILARCTLDVNPEYWTILGNVLHHDSSHLVRVSVAMTLGQHKNPNTTEYLIHTLTHDTDATVRENAAWALGHLADPKVLKPLLHTLQHDPNENVRYWTVNALQRINDPQTLQPLKTRLQKEPNQWIRAAIQEAIKTIQT